MDVRLFRTEGVSNFYYFIKLWIMNVCPIASCLMARGFAMVTFEMLQWLPRCFTLVSELPFGTLLLAFKCIKFTQEIWDFHSCLKNIMHLLKVKFSSIFNFITQLIFSQVFKILPFNIFYKNELLEINTLKLIDIIIVCLKL